jgi:hypothetical protein
MVMYYQEVDEHWWEAVLMGEKWMVNTIKAFWEHSWVVGHHHYLTCSSSVSSTTHLPISK